MKKLLTLLFCCFILTVHAQSFFTKDTVFNAKRTAWLSASITTGWVSSTIGLQTTWYKDNWTHFHFFDDSKQWLGMDKLGHIYTSNAIVKNISSLYTWAGVNKNTSLAIGSGVAFGFLTTLEVLDGFSDKWGFSWSDVGANALGIAWYVWQDLLWEEQRLKLKFSAYPSKYARYRPNTLGNNFSERILKDYNGQTYWLSVSPSTFMNKNSSFPKWLSISFGYSVDQKLHGDLNHYTIIENGKQLEFNAQSQFLLSLDIDLEKINTNKKWLSTLFKALNHIKIPFPALILTGNKLEAHPFYF